MALPEILLYAGLAGLAIPAGGLLAYTERLRKGHLRDDLLHGVVAFGGGVLLSAVALVLVPAGLHALTPLGIAASFGGGAVGFLLLDHALERRGGQVGQVLAMVTDFVPESIGLGAAFAMGGHEGPLLALLIGMQNLPEGFNAYREVSHAWGTTRTLGIMALLALLGPGAAILGATLLAGHGTLIAALFLVASGGILYAVFHDVAPLAHRTGHWVPTLGAALGFLAGLLGEAFLT